MSLESRVGNVIIINEKQEKEIMSLTSANQELAEAAKTGDRAKILKLLAGGADPRSEESLALRAAAYDGHEACVRLLLPLSDARAMESDALKLAAAYGHEECVRILLPASDPKAEGSYALRWAAQNGHAECVRLLLPVSDPTARDFEALRFAAEDGHLECVRILLAASRPFRGIGGLLKGAIEEGRAKMAALLIEEEPRLLDGINLSKCLAEALAQKHSALASYFSAIIDQRALSGIDQNRAASRPVAARL